MIKKLLPLTLLAIGACDSNGSGTEAPDASVNPPDPATRSGTISIIDIVGSEATVGAQGGGLPEFFGPSILVEYTDTETGDGEVLLSQGIPGCTVTKYDAGQMPSDQVDEGNVTITGGNAGDLTCAFNAALNEYLCQPDNPQRPLPPGTSIMNNGNGSATISELGIGTDVLSGQNLTLAGLGQDCGTANETPECGWNRGFGVALVQPDAIVIAGVSTQPSISDTVAGAAMVLSVGSPIPSPVDGFSGATDLTVTKEEGDMTPAFTVTDKPLAEGMDIDGVSLLSFPLGNATAPWEFTCTKDANGDCVGDNTGSGSLAINGWILSGSSYSTTTLNPLDPPVGTRVNYTCTFIGDSVSLAADVVNLVNGSSAETNHAPKFITVRALRARAKPANNDPESMGVDYTNMVMGHGKIGFIWTNPPTAQ